MPEEWCKSERDPWIRQTLDITHGYLSEWKAIAENEWGYSIIKTDLSKDKSHFQRRSLEIRKIYVKNSASNYIE